MNPLPLLANAFAPPAEGRACRFHKLPRSTEQGRRVAPTSARWAAVLCAKQPPRQRPARCPAYVPPSARCLAYVLPCPHPHPSPPPPLCHPSKTSLRGWPTDCTISSKLPKRAAARCSSMMVTGFPLMLCSGRCRNRKMA